MEGGTRGVMRAWLLVLLAACGGEERTVVYRGVVVGEPVVVDDAIYFGTLDDTLDVQRSMAGEHAESQWSGAALESYFVGMTLYRGNVSWWNGDDNLLYSLGSTSRSIPLRVSHVAGDATQLFATEVGELYDLSGSPTIRFTNTEHNLGGLALLDGIAYVLSPENGELAVYAVEPTVTRRIASLPAAGDNVRLAAREAELWVWTGSALYAIDLATSNPRFITAANVSAIGASAQAVYAAIDGHIARVDVGVRDFVGGAGTVRWVMPAGDTLYWAAMDGITDTVYSTPR